MAIPGAVWLRGPVAGIQPLLQPAAHAIIQVGEDITPIVADLSQDQVWARPGGVASIGFHIAHLPASLDRLLTYARGNPLSAIQLAALAAERTLHETRPALTELLAGLDAGIAASLAYLKSVPADSLLDAREVGRARLPSNVLGLIFHAAEHSSRHAGQVVTLVPIVRVQA